MINIITRTDTLNTVQSFILLVRGLSRKDMEDMGSRLTSIYHTVTSKLVTMAMPVGASSLYLCSYLHVVEYGVAQTKVSLMAHDGKGEAPEYIQDATADGFVCMRYLDESQISGVGPDCLDFIKNTIVPTKSIVLDLYGDNGNKHDSCVL